MFTFYTEQILLSSHYSNNTISLSRRLVYNCVDQYRLSISAPRFVGLLRIFCSCTCGVDVWLFSFVFLNIYLNYCKFKIYKYSISAAKSVQEQIVYFVACTKTFCVQQYIVSLDQRTSQPSISLTLSRKLPECC